MDLDKSAVEENYVNVRYSLGFDPFKDKLGCKEPKFSFTNKNPEEHVGDVVESKNLLKQTKVLPLRYQRPLVSNEETQLADLQIKLYKTEALLEASRKRMDLKRRSIRQQWRDLEEKEEQLRENFKEFNKFTRENYGKRTRATKKIEDDRKIIEERQQNIDDLSQELEDMITIMKKMEKNIKSYKIFQDYLERVVQMNAGFTSRHSIIGRFTALSDAKKLLLNDQRSNMDVLEHSKTQMMKLIEEKNFVIMGLNNQIANLQARYENANIKALESEELVTQIKNNAVKQLGEIDTVKNSIWNVYVHMATSKKHPIKIKKDNVEEQMMYINRTLTELSKVNKLIKKRSFRVK